MRLPNYLQAKDREDIAIEYKDTEYYISLDIEYRLKSGGYLDVMTFLVYNVVYYDLNDDMQTYEFSDAETSQLKELWLEKFESELELQLENEY